MIAFLYILLGMVIYHILYKIINKLLIRHLIKEIQRAKISNPKSVKLVQEVWENLKNKIDSLFENLDLDF